MIKKSNQIKSKNSNYYSATVLLYGKTGEITVNGQKYNSVMTAQTLSDNEVANVLTYVYNSWGNSKKEVTSEMVKARRK